DGGRTEFTNGRGLCAFHNHVREMPGWRAESAPTGITTTTPVGRTYRAGVDTRVGQPPSSPEHGSAA
ncbi:hypothetical protein ACFFTK_16595, partial [Pseudonocardia petroleophila]